MTNISEAQALLRYLQPRLPDYLHDLRELCSIESPSSFKQGVDEANLWVQRWVEEQGWDLVTWHDDTAGDSLIATIHGSGQLSVMLVAHLDTVYPFGTIAERSIRIEDDKLVGPGTADNKGGLLLGLYVMAALQSVKGTDQFNKISIVCGGDEETNMRSSVDLLREFAPSYDLALVLEPARPNGDIVGARKGIANFVLEVEGRAAHAGVEPHRGAHAILALAHQIIELQALNGSREGLTVNVGTVQGGTRPNVVPDYARAEIDVRVLRPEDMEPVTQILEQIASSPTVPGVVAKLSGGWQLEPVPRTPQMASLVELADRCAGELGFSVRDVATGGGSYSNPLTKLGIPLLDGLGPIGGFLHSPQEYIQISSIIPRAALLALLMLRWAQQANISAQEQ
jgi:glutamate carboxypeptidase